MANCTSRVENPERCNPLLAPSIDTAETEGRWTVPAYVTLPRLLGVLALTLFCLQIATGILLMIYYRPSAAAAHYSTGVIVDEVHLGWLIRSLHRRGADFLILLVGIHLLRVYFSRAYQRPRHLLWTSGMLLLLLVLAFDLTGVLLPWDQYAYWSTDFLKQALMRVPLLGGILVTLLWGGVEIGEGALLRFYAFHIAVLPWMVVPLMAAHVFMMMRTGPKPPEGAPAPLLRSRVPLVPDFALDVLIAFLLAFGALVTLAVVFPSRLGEAADPLSPLIGAEPRWYLMPMHYLLQISSGASAVVFGILLLVLLFLLPVIDARPDESAPRKMLRYVLAALLIGAWVLLGARGYLSL